MVGTLPSPPTHFSSRQPKHSSSTCDFVPCSSLDLAKLSSTCHQVERPIPCQLGQHTGVHTNLHRPPAGIPPGTGPFPVFGSIHQTPPHWILMDVFNQRPQSSTRGDDPVLAAPRLPKAMPVVLPSRTRNRASQAAHERPGHRWRGANWFFEALQKTAPYRNSTNILGLTKTERTMPKTNSHGKAHHEPDGHRQVY